MTRSSKYREVILPAGLLASLIIGAGIFALPFVFEESGLLIGALYLTVFTAVFTAIHKMYAEIIGHTPGRHRFVGYAEIYLGKKGFWTGTVTTAVGLTLVLTVYVVLAGKFLDIVFPQLAGSAAYLFWVLGSLAIVLSLRRLANVEFFVTFAIGLIILLLFSAGILHGGRTGIPLVGTSNLFLPYGAVLFALSGRAAISTLWDYYRRNRISVSKLPRSIAVGTAVPAVLYLLFIIGVLMLSGASVSEDALSGLIGVHPYLLLLAGLLGILALWTSYFFLGLEVRDIVRYDLGVRPRVAVAVVVFLPIILYMFGLKNFIGLVGVSGGVFLAAESAMVVFMYSRMKKWSVRGAAFILVFAIGAIYEIAQIL